MGEEKMIIVGDIHVKSKEPYISAIRKLFIKLIETYNESDGEFVFLGDLFDTSSPHNEIEADIVSYLKRMKKVILLSGNHDISRRMGNTLLHLKHHDNIRVITDITEESIANKKYLFLPYRYNMDEYKELKGTYDYIFTHVTPQECAFGDEGIAFHPELQGVFIHGHYHMQKDFIDNYKRQHHIVGVPIATRHLEDQQEHRVLEIRESLNFIKVEPLVRYRTIRFGEDVDDNCTDVFNVIDAPSVQAVYEKYNNLYIRREGIELLTEIGEYTSDLEKNHSIQSNFLTFAEENNIDKNIVDLTLHYLEFIK